MVDFDGINLAGTTDLIYRSQPSPFLQSLQGREQFNRLNQPEKKEQSMNNVNQKRVVRIFIADPDQQVPVADSILFKSEEKLTDLTDQELFYEIPIKASLDEHNLKRVKMLDKAASQKAGKDVFLEPIKIRDLRMTVVAIATF